MAADPRARLARDFERLRRTWPREIAAHVRETYRIDLAARYLGVPIPHPVGKGSGQLSLTLGQLEADGKGIPVLLRQYLKLNARVLGFNVDPEFGDALDALMMVDLMDVDPAILRRYFGREGAEQLIGRSFAA